jgi:hypothetical protein
LPDTPAFFLRAGCAPPGTPRTLIVLGPARSGTSMAAAMLQEIGVAMGEGLGATVQDAVLSDMARRHLDLGQPLDMAALDRVIAERNARHTVWGWKFPSHILEPFYRRMRAPHLVVMLRDPVAVALRESRAQGLNPELCLSRAVQDLARLAGWLETVPWPVLYLSYERAMIDRAATARALAGFAGLEPPDAVLAAAIASARARSPEYLAETRARQVEGVVEAVGEQVSGWLRRPHAPGQRVAFTLVVDGIAVASAEASQFREDLARAFGTDGRHAFAVALPPALRDGRQHRVELRVAGEADQRIANNGKAWDFPR